MSLIIISVGKLKNNFIKELIKDYLKRLNKLKIEFIEIKETNPIKEKEDILNKITKIDNKNIFLLSEEGKLLDSYGFTNILKDSLLNNTNLVFVIGNYYGIDISLKEKFPILSLSKMTFTHEIARLLLIEQIYRAYTIINNLPYHK
ncbi:MAG: 23S rRNA (pseudouridine(1915)-N(3))-methyltransferase RlmH [Candidatus Woesearchaeota archaeon]